MTSRIVIVDPFEDSSLAELADLSGVAWLRVRAWPFECSASDRLVTTVPVPAGARSRALGVAVGDCPREAEPGEVWPDLTLPLENRAEILAYMGGSHSPQHTRIGVLGLRGGVGTTYLAACVARMLTHHPLTVALVDDDARSALPDRLGCVDAWRRIDVDGPLLPSRLDSVAPLWQRVRVVAGHCPGPEQARRVSAALARSHDVVVEDRGRLLCDRSVDDLDLVVPVFSGERADLDVWEEIAPAISGAIAPVVRCYPTGAVREPDDIADFLNMPVIRFAHEKDARTGPRVGAEPGDRRRTASSRAASSVVNVLLDML